VLIPAPGFHPRPWVIYSIASRLGTNRITFEPYTHHQLIEILTARLRGVLGSHSVRARTLG